jgi:hypothetical protein
MKRLVELDVLRGLLLLLMVVNHSPSPLRRFTDQAFGFFSTAECFVFVSAFLAGMLFQKRSERLGFNAARSATVSRALRIYRMHLFTVLFAFCLGGFFLAQLPGMQNILDPFLKNPRTATYASLALIFQPPLMDILPMYILFSLLTPLAFWAARRWGWKNVFLGSVALWLLSQFRVRELLVSTAAKGFTFVNLGPFDLLSWQLLWIGGLIFGRSLQEKKPVLRLTVWWELFLLILGIGFLAWRWILFYFNVDPGREFWFLEKWHLGPLRVLNFFVVAWFVSKLLPVVNRWGATLRPLSLVGQNLLPVFASQTCLSLVILGLLDTGQGAESLSTALVLCQLATVFLAAWFFDWRTRSRINSRTAQSPLPAAF